MTSSGYFLVVVYLVSPCSLKSSSFRESSKACIIDYPYLNVLSFLQTIPNANETYSKELLCGEFGLFKHTLLEPIPWSGNYL